MSQNNDNPPLYTPEVTSLPIASEPITMYPGPIQTKPTTNAVESKSKVRTIIPFFFVDIDITDFPCIRFI
jgi:hypothetical protein